MLHQRLYEAQQPVWSGRRRSPCSGRSARIADKKQTALFIANGLDEIHRALDFAEDNKFHPSSGVRREAYRCLDRLKSSARGVIVAGQLGKRTVIEPNKPSEALVAQQKDPLRSSTNDSNRWKRRSEASRRSRRKKSSSPSALKVWPSAGSVQRRAAGDCRGLLRQAALAALTRDAALLLGLDTRLGTLSAGKLAHITVLNGPFDDERRQSAVYLRRRQRFEYNKGAERSRPGLPRIQPPVWRIVQMEIEAADGKVAATLELTQTASNLSGVFHSQQGDGKISQGSWMARKVEFVWRSAPARRRSS